MTESKSDLIFYMELDCVTLEENVRNFLGKSSNMSTG